MFNHNIIHNSQDIETTKAPIDEWTVKENIVYIFIYIMEYYSAIKKQWNIAIYNNMDSPWGHYVNWNKKKTNTVWFNLHVKSRKQKTKPCSSAGKESACHAGDPGLIPGSGRFAG